MILFQDLGLLEPIKRAVMVLDECQRRRISEILKQIKMLTADMKLVLVNHEVHACLSKQLVLDSISTYWICQDGRFNYPAVLSFLDSGFHEHAMDIDPNVYILIV